MSVIRKIAVFIALALGISACSSLSVLPVPAEGTADSGRKPPSYFAVPNSKANYELVSRGTATDVYIWRAQHGSTRFMLDTGILEFCIRIHNKHSSAIEFDANGVKSALGEKAFKVLTGNSIYHYMESVYSPPGFFEFLLIVLSGTADRYSVAVSTGKRAARRALVNQQIEANKTVQGSAYVHYDHYRELVTGDQITVTVNAGGEQHRFLFCISDSADGCPDSSAHALSSHRLQPPAARARVQPMSHRNRERRSGAG